MTKRNGSGSFKKAKKSKKASRVPVTILSGFLGSGKTTLLRHILTSKDHGLKIAVVVNDMAELNIDGQTIKNKSVVATKPEVVTLENGCICCNLRGDLIREIYKIQQQGHFDYVLVESTGIAEPQQVAESFCVDPETMALVLENEETQEVGQMLMNAARLDTCVTVVDALHFPKLLSSVQRFKEMFNDGLVNAQEQEGEKSISELLVEQVEFANVILLNKVDLVTDENLNISKALIQTLNPKARVVMGSFGKINVREILNTKLFNMEEASQSPGWLMSMREHGVNGAPGEAEEYGVSSFVYRSRIPFHPLRLHSFLTQIFCFAGDWNTSASTASVAARFPKDKQQALNEKYGTILRSKGTCWIAGRDDHVLEWAQTGHLINFEANQTWFCKMPRDEWGHEKEEDLQEIESKIYREDEHGNRVKYQYGDRRQEIVFIGTELRQSAIEEALRECSLSADEMKQHSTQLPVGSYPDPLEPMLVVCDGPKNLFAIARSNQKQHIRILPTCSLTLQNLALLVRHEDHAMIQFVRVWLDKTDDVESGLLLATLRPISYEQHSLCVTLLPCDEKGGEQVSNRRIRVEVVTKKAIDPLDLMNACEIHIAGKVEPIPYHEGDDESNANEEEGLHEEDCSTGQCEQ